MTTCQWCENNQLVETTKDCYWKTPDGRRSVQIVQIPAVQCSNCGTYLLDSMNEKVEVALYVGDLSGFPDTFTYDELLKAPPLRLFQIGKG